MLRTLAPVAALLISVGFLLMGSGLQGTLLPVRAQLENFSSYDIGIMGSAYFVGFALGCVLAPYAIRRAGHIRAFAAMVSIASTLSLAHALILLPELWWVFRGLTGFCFAGLYMIIESWLMEKSSNETRGFVFSVYTIVNLTVITVGQLLTAVDDPFSFPLFALASILVSLAAVPVAMTKAAAPEVPHTVRIRPIHLYRISPVGVVGSFAVGLVNGSFWSLGPVFAQREEGNVTEVAIFMSLVVIAGALGQWPLGRASDKFDRRLVLVFGCLGSACAGVGLALASRYFVADNVLFAAAVAFGAFALPLYAICAAHVNDHIEADGFVEAASGLLLFYSAGAIAGPLIAAAMIEAQGVQALFMFTAMVHTWLLAFALYRMMLSARPSKEDRGTFAEAATMAQAVSTIDTFAETSEDDGDNGDQSG